MIAVMTMVFGVIVYSLVVANLTVFLEEYGRKQAAGNHQDGQHTGHQPEKIRQDHQ